MTDFLTLWNVADVAPGAPVELLDARLEWQAERSHGHRLGVPIARDYSFDPDRPMDDWTPGRTLTDYANISQRFGIPILLCGLRHAQGGPNGWGGGGVPAYHHRDPLLDVRKLARWWRDLLQWADESPMILYSRMQDGNEFDYLPTVDNSDRIDVYERYLEGAAAIREEIDALAPRGTRFVLGSNSGRATTRRGITLAEWIATNPLGREVFDEVDVHGNSIDDDEFDAELRHVRSNGIDVTCLECRDHLLRSNRADIRYLIARRAGAKAYTAFFTRVVKRWGVRQSSSHSNERKGVLFDTPRRVIDENAERFQVAARHAGLSFRNAPMPAGDDGGQEEPPTPPGVRRSLEPFAKLHRRAQVLAAEKGRPPRVTELTGDERFKRRVDRLVSSIAADLRDEAD